MSSALQTTQRQHELPLTDRVIEGNIIDTVLNPFLGRNNQPGDTLPSGITMIDTSGTGGDHVANRSVTFSQNTLQFLVNNRTRGATSTELKHAFDKLNKNLDR